MISPQNALIIGACLLLLFLILYLMSTSNSTENFFPLLGDGEMPLPDEGYNNMKPNSSQQNMCAPVAAGPNIGVGPEWYEQGQGHQGNMCAPVAAGPNIGVGPEWYKEGYRTKSVDRIQRQRPEDVTRMPLYFFDPQEFLARQISQEPQLTI